MGFADYAGFSSEAGRVKLRSWFENAPCTPTQLEIKILKLGY
jgi:hypothetical protein